MGCLLNEQDEAIGIEEKQLVDFAKCSTSDFQMKEHRTMSEMFGSRCVLPEMFP